MNWWDVSTDDLVRGRAIDGSCRAESANNRSSSGTVDYMPIHFMHKSVNFDELLALYAVSDACIVSSTRDGMNLVSFEYIASQQKRQGVLILSEFAGAAQSLNGSLVVNPWNTEDLAKAYLDAVSMDPEQRAVKYQKLWKYISKYTRFV
jgi:trehalose 6-phosphate synthase